MLVKTKKIEKRESFKMFSQVITYLKGSSECFKRGKKGIYLFLWTSHRSVVTCKTKRWCARLDDVEDEVDLARFFSSSY